VVPSAHKLHQISRKYGAPATVFLSPTSRKVALPEETVKATEGVREVRTFTNVAVTKTFQRRENGGQTNYFIVNKDIYCPGSLGHDEKSVEVGEIVETISVFSNPQGLNKWRGTKVKWAKFKGRNACGAASTAKKQPPQQNMSLAQQGQQGEEQFVNVKVTMVKKHFFVVTPDVYCPSSKLVPEGMSVKVGDILPRAYAVHNGKDQK
jgi:hypothetical protein